MPREFVEVTYRVKDPLHPAAGIAHMRSRVAVDELWTFLSVVIRNGGRNFSVREVKDNSQTQKKVDAPPIKWERLTITATKERSLFERVWKALRV